MKKISETLLSKLYNREDKELFLKEYLEDDDTRESYIVFLIQASEFEKIIDKDLYQFSSTDVIDMFANHFTSSPTSLRALFSICKQYANWGSNRGLNKTGTNVFNTLNFINDILPLLNKRELEEKYITEEKLWQIASMARNVQDSICVVLPFYSLKGNKSVELTHLTRNDIDTVTNTVTVVTKVDENDNILETRKVILPQKVINLILEAWGQEIYIKQGSSHLMSSTCELSKKGDYVIKTVTSVRNGVIYDKPTRQLIATRSKKLLDETKNYKCSINDIYNMGKIHLLKTIKEQNENGELTIDDFKLVQIEFGDDPKNYSNIKNLWNQLSDIISKTE